jgi:predicted nucleic acid-binding protein
MQQQGISTIWTHDRDLRRFKGISVREPFSD